MIKRRDSGRGFTLIELMIVVAILGIIAAIAIPAFMFFVSRSKTAEAANNLNSMFKSAAAYYNSEKSEQSMSATTTGECIVGNAGPAPGNPGSNKQKFGSALPNFANFKAIHFSIADYIYYSYTLESAAGATLLGSCGHLGGEDLYTFIAEGNLDGDGVLSNFELAAAADVNNSLYHARGIFIERESE